ncbi:MAG: hypothetical protein WCL10_11300 [Novosphingobium sp.]|uniref:hypothetical protein n=1 Tax=Novosphingobium sp. TaxID=1874826 RepID=UPI00301A8E22
MPARAPLLALAALLLPTLQAHAQGQTTTGVGSQFELTYWQSVESGSDPALYEAYLAQYPNGTFAPVARVKLAKLRQTAPAPVPMVPATAQIAPPPEPAPIPGPIPNVAQAATQAPGRLVTPALTLAATPTAAPAPAPEPARRQLGALAANTAPRDHHTAGASRSGSAQNVPTTAAPAAAKPGAYVTPAPFVTPALPPERPIDGLPAPSSEDSAALRRLLGVLGESQRAGAPPPAPIVDVPAPDETAALVEPQTSPTSAPPATGPSITVPDAAALSASASSAGDLRPIAVGPLPAGFALPPRPALAAIPPLALPGSFCSAEARNTYHDGPYITAVQTAKRNNDAAIAYMRRLQDLYDRNQLTGDINPMNAVAAEARAYGPVAAAAFDAQSTLVNAFVALMAVPIVPCEAPR